MSNFSRAVMNMNSSGPRRPHQRDLPMELGLQTRDVLERVDVEPDTAETE